MKTTEAPTAPRCALHPNPYVPNANASGRPVTLSTLIPTLVLLYVCFRAGTRTLASASRANAWNRSRSSSPTLGKLRLLHILEVDMHLTAARVISPSYGDLWTLAGCVAIERMGGPKIDWRPGRKDAANGSKIVEDGRLPDAARSSDHIRNVFYRMGFSDREMVALIGGGHTIGRCHTDRSGFSGPWTVAPTRFTNLYFKDLLKRTWVEKKWDGPRQFEDKESGGKLMMLPTDIAFRDDPKFRPFVELYAKDKALFFKDFAAVFKKLVELGCGDNLMAGCPAMRAKL